MKVEASCGILSKLFGLLDGLSDAWSRVRIGHIQCHVEEWEGFEGKSVEVEWSPL
jgi:hypothetical protein